MTSNLTGEGRERGRTAGNRKQADRAVSEYWDLLPDIYRHRSRGETLRQIADGLNARGITTRQGAAWSGVQVKRLLDRTRDTLEFVIQKRASAGWYDWQGGFSTYEAAEAALARLDGDKHRIEIYSR
jgi:Recombinase